MRSCWSGGGGAAYGIDIDIIKSTSTSIRTSNSSSSPSSTISESSHSPIFLSTRKPRTPRKRPNQTYNEAAALLSTAYPKIFPTEKLSKTCKFIKPHEYSSLEDLLLPFPADHKPVLSYDNKPCSILRFQSNPSNFCDGFEDFDTESILDEDIEEGAIDNIMGNNEEELHNFCYGYPVGLGPLVLGLGERIDFGFGMMRGGGVVKSLRQNHEGDDDWWRFPIVDVGLISPKFNDKLFPTEKKQKVVEKLSPKSELLSNKEDSTHISTFNSEMLLKLNYDEVLNAWSDKGSPFSEEIGSQLSGSDALARLDQIDLFGENEGALREASVQRYKEKRRNRLFSKKIRYEVRKVNADQRPRMKGTICTKREFRCGGREITVYEYRHQLASSPMV